MAAAGDIAIVGFGADAIAKSFAFVLLDSALAGQTISFTDNGWFAAGGFRSNEGTASFVVPTGATLGQVFTISNLTGQFNPSTAGDQILAYVGSAANPTFLFAVDFADGNSTWAADATSSNTSAVPFGLANGVSALAFFPLDNAAYSGPTAGTKAQILANIANSANWTLDDMNLPAYPTAFSLGGATTVSIGDASIAEGDAGTVTLSFTVTRSDNSGAFTVDFATADGSATTADNDYVAAAGTLSFAAGGALTQTVNVTVRGDTLFEPNETLAVGLANLASSVGSATIADASGIGTIVNDDIVLSFIHDIQGTAYFSPVLAAEGITTFNTASATQVTVRGIVTAIDSFAGSANVRGFYISEEVADWDADSRTSEGIFVRTPAAVTGLTVGETVTVTANVMEFQSFANLNRTFLINPVITQSNDSQALPTLVLDGSVGRKIPNAIISNDSPNFTDSFDDANDSFDADSDALDFYETVEGMRVTIPSMVVGDGFVGGSNDNFVFFNAYSTVHADPSLINSRGGYTITGDPQFYPVDTADPSDDVQFGGAVMTDGATHGDIIELDFGDVGRGGASGFDELLTMGDQLGDVSGIVDFDFGVTKLYVTDALDPVALANLGGSPAQEVTALAADPRALRIATFNVENLSPVGTTFSTNNGIEITTQAKYDALAANVKDNLLSPDILIIEEVQDNNGVTQDALVEADVTWGQLVAAINAATGKTYQWVDEAPETSGDVGGAPGGNIRVGFLYDTATVQLGDLAADASLAERRQYTDRIGDGVRTAGDLIGADDSQVGGINPTDWAGTRRSIVGEFTFNGLTVNVFGSHLPSKGGSGEPYQINQDNLGGQPANGDWALRNTLAQDVWSVQDAASQAGNLVVSGGDFNEFWFYRPLEVLTGYVTDAGVARVGGTRYANLMVDELSAAERFSYDFDGRSQALDSLLADQALAAVADFDAVHINTGYNDRSGAVNPASSDHDPSLARFDLRSFDERLLTTSGDDTVDGFGGTDTFVFTGNRAGYSITNGGHTVFDINAADGNDGTDTLSNFEYYEFADMTVATNSFSVFTLQLLHLSDGEAGTLASTTAPYLAALVDAFEDDYAHSITLAGGDTYLPGPFLAAGTDPSVVPVLNAVTGSTIGASGAQPGVVDTAIHNLLGVEASGIGNHEWDLGSNVYLSTIAPGGGWGGANYVSVSANIDFAPAGFPADPLNARYTNTVGAGLEEASTLKGRIVPSAVITEGGEKIGLVGVTTQILEQISSPSGAEIKGFPFGPGANGEFDDMALLAMQLQPVIDDLLAQGVNKVVLMSHLQLIGNEQTLAPLLTGVDIILAAGSNTRLGDADDVAVAFPGHAADFANTYPIVTAGADGVRSVIVNTDNEYTYLGRLVVDFDSNGVITDASLAANVPINGAYASTAENVADAWGTTVGNLEATAFADGTRGDDVRDLTDAVQAVITLKDGNVYGYTNVYLEGERSQVRNQETNLGNLSADANADVARDALGLTGESVMVSIKNGGGIRAQIGTLSPPDPIDGTVDKLPPEVGGEVSQLDVENALRFNNALMVFDTTAQGLLNILNTNNALTPNNGGFIQIGGVRFSYDPTKAAGTRVQDVVLINELDEIVGVVADDGVVVAGAPATITAVALNFTANGGDGYVIKPNADNFRYLLNDGTLSAPVDEALDFNAAAPANVLREQQALAEYFQERYPTPEAAYDTADTPQSLDTRIQNQVARTDTVLVGSYATLGTAGNDTLDGTANADILRGLAGEDVLNGFGGNDVLVGGPGADRLFGGEGRDAASYDSSASAVTVNLSNRTGSGGDAAGDRYDGIEDLIGSDFDDVLIGSGGDNRIWGGDGNDIIRTGSGADSLYGEGGDDTFILEYSPLLAVADGGAGFDTVQAGRDGTIIRWTSAFTGIEKVDGGGFANVTIAGNAGNDVIDLTGVIVSGIVEIRGWGGSDTLTGSDSADTLRGDAGADWLAGGDGGDRFVFGGGDSGRNLAAADTIGDFLSAEGDKIDLSAIDAILGGAKDIFSFLGEAEFTGTAGELRYELSGSDAYVMADRNGDGRTDFMVVVSNTASLAVTDFII